MVWWWDNKSPLVDGAPGVKPINNDKEFTIILWDARYREDLTALECLSRQTIRDKTNFIFLEWSDNPNPEVEKYDFIDIYCMNLPINLNIYPTFDTGLQLNLGLYLANTEWLTYLHCDYISDNQLEIILNKTKDKENKDIIYMEGYAINAPARRHGKEGRAEYKQLVKKYGSKIDPYKYKEYGKFVAGPHSNGILLTTRKNRFIKKVGGFLWNVTNQSEVWCGIGYEQKRLGGHGMRRYLAMKKMARLEQRDMIVYTIPHGRQERDYKHRPLTGGIKYYNHFVKHWLPRHKITHYKKSVN